MTAAPTTAPNPLQLQAANFLNLLVVDDERAVRDVCREVAQSLGFNTSVAESAENAYRQLDAQSIDVVLLDLKLPGVGGFEALHQIKERRPDAVVVVVTGYRTVQSAVQAMKNGAHLKLKTANRSLREQIKSRQGFGNMVGRSPEMEKLYRIIAKAAQSSHPVLILGESGTGKEMVARSIHFSGPCADKPFIPVGCGSLVPTLIESELFGYVKGAFTGAMQAKDGLLAIAEGGKVFLDEVGELENCLERSCAFTSNSIIQVRDLPSDIHGTHNLVVGGNGSAKIVPIEQLEKQTILNTIEQLNGDKLQAARLLGIGKTTLYRKLKEYAAQG